MRLYLNKKYSYPINILGEITLEGEKYYITKATPLEEDMEVVVKLLKVHDVFEGIKTKKYTTLPMKEVKERSNVLDYEKSQLCLEFYEAGYEDALQDLGVWSPEDEEDDISSYSLYPDLFYKMEPEERLLTSIGIELPEKRLNELRNKK